MFTLGARVLLQEPTQIGAVFRHFAPNSALHTPIDNSLKFSAHKHKSQRRSQKKISQFILSLCVRTWFASTISGTNQIWVDIFIRAKKPLMIGQDKNISFYFPAEGNIEASFSWVSV